MDDGTLRRSPIDDRHRQLGATMTAFAGWDMPLDYGSVVAEHRAVREHCGVFDLSHLGTLRVTGDGAEDTVQQAFTNDASALAVGRAHYTLCLTEDGGIVDDLLVYRLDWGFFVVPNAANSAAVEAVLRGGAGAATDCEVVDVKADLACIAVQGPESAQVVTNAGVDVSGMGYLDCRPLALAGPGPAAGAADRGHGSVDASGAEDAAGEAGAAAQGIPPQVGVLARSGYTGERGYELFTPAEVAPTLWDRLVEGGATPAGLGARDTLRLEMGYPLHGNDIGPGTSPVEARLGWAVKTDAPFVGREAYLTSKATGPRRRLWGLRASGRGIPRANCRVLRDGAPVGETTSGTFSPMLRVGIAMAYLDADVDPGEHVAIDVRGRLVTAEVLAPPFVDSDPKK